MRSLALVFLAITAAPAQPRPALLLISIDGLRPDYVLQADQHQLKIPHLRRILAEGAHATGVRGVLPTVTYPSHTTLITGVWPVKHHIYSNLTFDPLNKNLGGWYWYAEDIASPTLWEAVADAGMEVGSVSWPVSVRARGVRYLIPEYWRAPQSADDAKLLRSISTPGLMEEIAKQAGPYVNDLDQAEAGDRARTNYAAVILRSKRPQLMTVHLAALDHQQHSFGPFSPESLTTLEESDREVGELEEAARSSFPNVTVCIVSDHGFARTEYDLNLTAAFAEAGLLTMKAGAIEDWKAYPKSDGGSASIFLKDKADTATRTKVAQLLDRLRADPANGIAAILQPAEIAALGGSPDAAFWVDMQTSFAVVASGPLHAKRDKVGGSHGYSPTHPELLASFFIAGPLIQRGVDLGEIDMRSVAPTLARALGLTFPTANGRVLDIF